MVFSSLLFLFRFLPLVLLCYYLAPGRAKNLVLFICSLIFYAWGEPVYVALILLSTVVDYTAGRIVAYYLNKDQRKKAKRAVIGSAVVNLSLLGFFKYADFLIGIVNLVSPLELDFLELALPIGISFYTFQTMSYTIDVYRGEAEMQKNFITFGAYVSLFPQLIAGPIVRYQTVAKQLTERKESVAQFAEGVLRFTVGLGKKVLIANQMGELFQEISSLTESHLSTSTAWLGVVAFTLQIYFDFSGYSDMAIGLGHMFGFRFLENFDHPYESKSITEFWRRWHISLGTWFREYVYIPLGGNRKGRARQIVNLFLVWFLTGLWHGAAWNFVLWGLYYGALLVLEKLCLNRVLEKMPVIFRHIYTMLFVMFGWAIFSYADMADGAMYIRTLFGLSGAGVFDNRTLYSLFSNGGILVIAILGSTSLAKRVFGDRLFPKDTVRRTVAASLFIVFVFGLSVAALVNSSYNPFLYFRF